MSYYWGSLEKCVSNVAKQLHSVFRFFLRNFMSHLFSCRDFVGTLTFWSWFHHSNCSDSDKNVHVDDRETSLHVFDHSITESRMLESFCGVEIAAQTRLKHHLHIAIWDKPRFGMQFRLGDEVWEYVYVTWPATKCYSRFSIFWVMDPDKMSITATLKRRWINGRTQVATCFVDDYCRRERWSCRNDSDPKNQIRRIWHLAMQCRLAKRRMTSRMPPLIIRTEMKKERRLTLQAIPNSVTIVRNVGWRKFLLSSTRLLHLTTWNNTLLPDTPWWHKQCQRLFGSIPHDG